MSKLIKMFFSLSLAGFLVLLFGCLSSRAQEVVGEGVSILSVICLVIVGLFWVMERGAAASKWYTVLLRAAGAGLVLALVGSLIAALGHCYDYFWLRRNVWEALREFYKDNWIGIVLAAAFFVVGSFAITETLRAEFKDCDCESLDDTADITTEVMRGEERQ